MGSLISIVNTSKHTKRVSLSCKKCMIQPSLLHPNECCQFHYYLFAITLDRCVRTCNFLNDLSNKVCVPNKTEDLSLNVFNMIIEKNGSKALAKHISCECKCRSDGKNVIQINVGITINVDLSEKGHHLCEKDYIWSPLTSSYENGKYLASIKNDLPIMCDEVIESKDEKTKATPKKFNRKKGTC